MNFLKTKNIEINLELKGKTYFRHETSISFSFDGEEYWFTMIEKGDVDYAPGKNEIDFISDEDLPFDLTEEMKTEMYQLAWES